MTNKKGDNIPNGTKIESVTFANDAYYKGPMELLHAYHGEYDLDWAIFLNADGSEKYRLNLKNCEYIEWGAIV